MNGFGRRSGWPFDELARHARLEHVLDSDELSADKQTYLELYDEVLALYVAPLDSPPSAIEWLFASMITADLWRANRAIGGVRARVQELETADPSEARRRAFADADERRRLRNVCLDAATETVKRMHLLQGRAVVLEITSDPIPFKPQRAAR